MGSRARGSPGPLASSRAAITPLTDRGLSPRLVTMEPMSGLRARPGGGGGDRRYSSATKAHHLVRPAGTMTDPWRQSARSTGSLRWRAGARALPRPRRLIPSRRRVRARASARATRTAPRVETVWTALRAPIRREVVHHAMSVKEEDSPKAVARVSPGRTTSIRSSCQGDEATYRSRSGTPIEGSPAPGPADIPWSSTPGRSGARRDARRRSRRPRPTEMGCLAADPNRDPPPARANN